MDRDIIERLMDFEHCGVSAADRVKLRELAAAEIFKLRREVVRLEDIMLIRLTHTNPRASVWSSKQGERR